MIPPKQENKIGIRPTLVIYALIITDDVSLNELKSMINDVGGELTIAVFKMITDELINVNNKSANREYACEFEFCLQPDADLITAIEKLKRSLSTKTVKISYIGDGPGNC